MDPTRRYREIQVKTASQEDLLLLLLDGGVRFTEGALLEMEKGTDEDRARRSDQLVRAQKIILELMGALSPAIGLELYQNLQDLYRFTFRRLFEGNVKSDRELVGEGLCMYERMRELWREAVERSRREKTLSPNPAQQPNSTISVQG